MPKKYVLKTVSGSLYEVHDKTHVFGSDHWVLNIKGIDHPVLFFGKLSHFEKDPAFRSAMPNRVFLKALEGEIGQSLKSRSCVDHIIVYVPENHFKAALKHLEELRRLSQIGDRSKIADLWDRISREVEYSSEVTEVFEE